MKKFLLRFSQYAIIFAVGLAIIVVVGIVMGEKPVHALPEFVERTGESCATCHVDPGGGGPRTLRGLLWAAQGRPDQVPELGDILIAPGVDDGVTLYDIACSACHGTYGEGLFGLAIAGSGIEASKMRSAILRGRIRSGMPGFEGQFTDAQLDALVDYTAGIAAGELEPAPASYPLPSGKLECVSYPDTERCGGN